MKEVDTYKAGHTSPYHIGAMAEGTGGAQKSGSTS